MHRWTSLLLGLLLAAALAIIFLKAPLRGASRTDSAVSAEPIRAPAPALPTAATSPTEMAEPASTAEVPALPGTPASLPPSAPRSVTFGVILIRYAGAEGAPPGTRSKGVAKQLAESLMTEARTDFASAVARGDRGSTSNAGRVPIDVLESALEYALFTLGPGQVHPEPLDTPKGYWIVKRLK